MVTIDRCPICGGNAGRIPEGGHYLCQARKRHGQPTPSLGERCTLCGGSGMQRRNLTGAILPMIPSGESIRRWFPPCEACHGKGYV